METDDMQRRWADWGNMIIGIALFISPFIREYPDDLPEAMWNAFGSGLAVMTFAAVAVYLPRAWEEGINTLLGVWLVAAPWALGFSHHRDIATISIFAGCAVMILALWAMWVDKTLAEWRHRH